VRIGSSQDSPNYASASSQYTSDKHACICTIHDIYGDITRHAHMRSLFGSYPDCARQIDPTPDWNNGCCGISGQTSFSDREANKLARYFVNCFKQESNEQTLVPLQTCVNPG